MKRFFITPLPLYAVVCVFIILFSCLGYGAYLYRQKVYNYQLLLSAGNRIVPGFQYGSWPALSRPDFFHTVKEQFISEKVNFIEADLSAMKLRLYRDGLLQREFPILTKGKPGSWWETPAGLYRIENKEKNHFSTFGKVYQPWSMAFQGNFFIHGWPYYPDGGDVSSQYSGGCIRLSTPDAQDLFSQAALGMPVLVFEQDFTSDSFTYTQKIPAVSARQYLVADIANNFVFLGKDADLPAPIASITKLITALVSSEYINIERPITIDQKMIVPTSKPRLVAGKTVTPFSLFFPLLQESSNEAAQALSRTIGSERFVKLANDKARSIGLVHAHFVDPAGVEAENVASSEDLFNLLKYLYFNRSFILNITAGRITRSAYGSIPYPDLANFNGFADDPTFLGGKVGETNAAGGTMASLFEIESAGRKRAIAIIVLGSDDYLADTRALLNYVRQNY